MGKIQKFISYILIFAVLCSFFQGKIIFFTSAEEITDDNILEQGSCGDNLTYTITKDKTLIISGSGTLTDSSGWHGNQEIKKIVVENGVTDIEDNAFSGCTLLDEITLPNTLTHCGSNIIKNTAFYNDEKNWEDGILYVDSILLDATMDCSSDLIIKEGTTLIANSAFYGNESLKTVIFPDGIKQISEYTFSCCSMLESIILPENLQRIEKYAFTFCFQLKDVRLPEKLEEIGFNAFGSCDLESITIPESVTKIDGAAFAKCANLNKITFPKSLQHCGRDVIKDTAFYNDRSNWEDGILYCGTTLVKTDSNCDANLKIKSGIRLIADEAFASNETVQTLDLGEDVMNIGIDCFYCKNLKGVILSPKLKKIGFRAFRYCERLSEVTFLNADTEIDNEAFPISKKCIFYGPESSTAYQYALENDIQFKLLSEKETTTENITNETTSQTVSTKESTSAIAPTNNNISIATTESVEKPTVHNIKNNKFKASIMYLKEKNWHSVKIRCTKKAEIKSYILYRSKKKKSKYKRITTTNKTSYLDTKVKAGTKYYYKVTITDNSGMTFTSKPKAIRVKGTPKKPKIHFKTTRQSWQIYWGILNDNSKGIDIYMKNDELKHKKYVLINRTTNIKKSRKKKGTTGIQSALSTLSKNRTYKFKARTYAVVKGKKVYSKWSKTIRYTRK